MEKFAVIVAGGTGVRMGADVPKQFLLLDGKALLWHSCKAFLSAFPDIHMIMVLPAAYIDAGRKAVADFQPVNEIIFAYGGSTRFESVKNGLRHVESGSVVFVHDAVRCLASETLLQRCFTQAMEKGSAIPAVVATDSVRLVKEDHHEVLKRNDVRIIQTPQTFLSDIILPAFDRSFDERFTDEATVVEASGTPVFLIEGEYDNIKITRPVDMMIAEGVLLKRGGF